MLRNYLRVALRALRKQKGYTAINVAGLAVGLACCGFIGLYVQDERSYDRFHERADRIVRVVREIRSAGQEEGSAPTSAPTGPALEAELPEVEHAVRFVMASGLLERTAGAERVRYQEPAVAYVDPTVFEVFTFPLLAGDSDRALVEPNAVVLTETLARKYFGTENPVGQALLLDDQVTLTVTGVMADVPPTSHLAFDAMVSYATWEATAPDWLLTEWNANYLYTYLLLPEGYDPAALEAKLPAFVERHLGAVARETFESLAFRLQPLTSIYLHSDLQGEAGPVGDPTRLYVFSLVGLFILLIACVNFTNLATARAATRAKEVGLRKSLGAWRSQLVGQFLGESVLVSLAAFVLAMALIQLLLPVFNVLAGKEVGSLWSHGGRFALALGALALVVGVGAGGYPAFFLSGFRPAAVLRGPFRGSRQGATLRKGLVVFQFAVTIVLLVGTAVVFRQLGYMRAQGLGFEGEQLLVIDFQGDTAVQERWEAVEAELADAEGVAGVSFSSSVPGERHGQFSIAYEGPDGTEQRGDMNAYAVDYAFVPTYGLSLAAGRNLSADVPTDTTRAYLLNEAAVAALGYRTPEEVIGRRFNLGGLDEEGEVVGVVRDFHYHGLREAVEPLVLHVLPEFYGYATARVRAGQAREAVAALERAWAEAVPHRPFEYQFLDERFDQQYRADEQFGRIFGVFAGLAILVACLGLFGLAAFTAQQRTKEIGVRKVLGASVASLVALLSRDVLKLVLVAFAVAAPLSWFAMSRWLEGFAYRTPLGPLVFLAAGALALLLALATVSTQALRAASADPIKALRYE
jgi:putative ABC transport system permease protein